MVRKVQLALRENYGGLRTLPVTYIVVHYTAGDGDSDEGNGRYFANNDTGNTSAHWFVDEDSATLSVPETYVAYHCGAKIYRHPECRNWNSIGVELCSEKDADGVYYFTEKTLDNAAELIRSLMKQHNVPLRNVVRHYDVTGKNCPAPFVGAGKADWENFKRRLSEVRYNTMDEMPEWAKPTVQKLLDRDLLQGTGTGLDLSHDMVRFCVILDRAGAFDRAEEVCAG